VSLADRPSQLVEQARRRRLSADEREEQLSNFVVGNVGLENPRVTRAVVDEAARRIGPAR
jgi:hypothetical protein